MEQRPYKIKGIEVLIFKWHYLRVLDQINLVHCCIYIVRKEILKELRYSYVDVFQTRIPPNLDISADLIILSYCIYLKVTLEHI